MTVISALRCSEVIHQDEGFQSIPKIGLLSAFHAGGHRSEHPSVLQPCFLLDVPEALAALLLYANSDLRGGGNLKNPC